MIKYFFTTVVLFIGLISSTFGQSFNLDFLFNPGVTLGSEYGAPATFNDSLDFQFSKYNFQFSQPLKTKVGVKGLDLKNFSFKKLDAKASQFFLNYNFSVIQPNVTDNNQFENLYKGGFGFTAITASLKKGIWLYSANVYATENSTTLADNFTPNFRGYLANIKTKNLRTFYIFGGGLLYHQGQLIPFPLLGFKTKLAPKLRTEIILPVHVKLNYRFSKKLSLDAVAHYNGINTVYRAGSAYSNTDQTVNVRQLKTYLALNAKFSKHFKFKVEAGYSSFQRFYSWSSKTSESIGSAPYVGLSINYNFGKSVFGNFMNQAE
ncbi:MAG: DUF6268 family outer membrane beta-barrel protein [Vicingaceae bacterium]|nr:DUF6268 family outer membrane beta-barrel protein [Vicingaceae bacterium]